MVSLREELRKDVGSEIGESRGQGIENLWFAAIDPRIHQVAEFGTWGWLLLEGRDASVAIQLHHSALRNIVAMVQHHGQNSPVLPCQFGVIQLDEIIAVNHEEWSVAEFRGQLAQRAARSQQLRLFGIAEADAEP